MAHVLLVAGITVIYSGGIEKLLAIEKALQCTACGAACAVQRCVLSWGSGPQASFPRSRIARCMAYLRLVVAANCQQKTPRESFKQVVGGDHSSQVEPGVRVSSAGTCKGFASGGTWDPAP